MKETEQENHSEVEAFISVDVETSGPIPGKFSLLSIGACAIEDDSQSFQCFLKPVNQNAVPEALKATGLSIERLSHDGLDPAEAMQQFKQWILEISAGATPVFVGLNAGFDWSFINYYFHLYLGENPFGFAPLDIKSLYMGSSGCSWRDTRSSKMADALHPQLIGDHDALHDARAQAELYCLIIAKR